MSAAPLVAITMGDPSGVGPEIVARVWGDPQLHALCRPVALGHPQIMARAAELASPRPQVVEITSLDDAIPSPTLLPCLRVVRDDAVDAPAARIDARGGQAAYDALVAAIDLALAGRVGAIVTGPLHKAALWKSGHHYPGHTELLAERCGVTDYAMMLYLPPSPALGGPAGLGVIHVTLHMGLAEAVQKISTAGVYEKIGLAHQVFSRLKRSAPRIAVCALNPHAGEEGLFGDEESRIIRPAVEAAQRQGIDVEGPFPADTLMIGARDGRCDAVVAMYHDQGHIALKLLGMHQAVNVTLGLPIVRTSVAHGTAFDLAWQGKAETAGLLAAVRVAAELARKS